MKEKFEATIEVIPILLTAFLGLAYTFLFVEKELVLMVIFSLQLLRGGMAFFKDR